LEKFNVKVSASAGKWAFRTQFDISELGWMDDDLRKLPPGNLTYLQFPIGGTLHMRRLVVVVGCDEFIIHLHFGGDDFQR